MKCKYLKTETIIIEAGDTYESVVFELKKVTKEEWENLEQIILKGVAFKYTEYAEIFAFIRAQNTPILTDISIGEIADILDSSNAESLSTFIQSKGIKALYLPNLHIASKEIDNLMSLLERNTQLEALELNNCELAYSDN